MRPSTSPPTPKQLAYLKALAQRTATSFAYPHDRSEASREIERLRQLPVLTDDRDSDAGRVLDSDRERGTYATAPAPGEIAGHGSSASLRHQGSRR
jgi:hypothetical protein